MHFVIHVFALCTNCAFCTALKLHMFQMPTLHLTQLALQRKSPIMALFLHSKQQKTYQWTQRTQELAPIGSKSHLGPSMDCAWPYYWTM